MLALSFLYAAYTDLSYCRNMQTMCKSNHIASKGVGPTFTMHILVHINLREATPTELSI